MQNILEIDYSLTCHINLSDYDVMCQGRGSVVRGPQRFIVALVCAWVHFPVHLDTKLHRRAT